MSAVLPDAALQQHVAALGKTGSGKTYALKGVVEGLLRAGRRVGIVDPTDAWWGLRSSHDGRGAGFPILVLGGDHGDLPLPANGGAAVARLLIEQGVNLVASTKHLTVGERTRWFIDFAGTINRLNRAPLHLVLDEAHNFAPQGKVPDPDTGRMLHAANTLASGGRSIGVRLIMITQRPQKLHKDTLTSADTLIAMRVLAPHDRQAVEDWIKGCGDMARGRAVLDSLASLKRGEGWIWYPEGGILARLKFPPIETFDSSATPTDGHAVATPKGAAEVNLEEVRAALADAVKEAEANDPKRLKVKIQELEKALQAKGAKVVNPPVMVDAEAVRLAEGRGYQRGHEDALRGFRRVEGLVAAFKQNVAEFTRLLDELKDAPAPKIVTLPFKAGPTPKMQRAQVHALGASEAQKPMPRAILTALAQHPDGLTKGQILVHSEYRSSGPVSKCFAELAREGWTEAEHGRLRITPAGLVALGSYEPLPTGEALREHLLNGSKLSPMEKKMLRQIFEAYPSAIGKGRILEETGYASSGPVSKAFARLTALGYATKDGRGALRAAEELFQ